MRAGLMDRRITLQRKVTSGTGTYGEPVDDWQVIEVVAADVRFGNDGVGGTEVTAAGRSYPKLTATFSIRYRSDITISPTLRILFDNQIFNIRAVAFVGRRERLMITGECDNAGTQL